MSMKLLWALLFSAAVIAPGVTMADPPKNYGQCVSAFNAKVGPPGLKATEKKPANVIAAKRNDKREDKCEKFKNDNDDKDNGRS